MQYAPLGSTDPEPLVFAVKSLAGAWRAVLVLFLMAIGFTRYIIIKLVCDSAYFMIVHIHPGTNQQTRSE